MGEPVNRIEVDILGETYILKGDEAPEYMEMLAQFVNKKMRQVIALNPKLGASKAAVLAALNIADELMKMQKEYEHQLRGKHKK
ncbi:MAG TPA: cell division protein ZapA [Desulfotomaculum sp.]|nr:cell division protein ZapA [Desulfotomaculum sp.]